MTGGPIQRVLRLLIVLVAVCVLGLIAGIVVVSIQNADTSRRLHVLEEYVQGKGEQRDRERARLEEQQRRGVCDLLDQLPEGGLLDRPRAKYGCGPGIPLDQLTPQEQQQLGRRAPAAPLLPSAGPSAAPATPARPSAPPAVPPKPSPTGPPAAPSSSPARPTPDLGEALCGLLPIC